MKQTSTAHNDIHRLWRNYFVRPWKIFLSPSGKLHVEIIKRITTVGKSLSLSTHIPIGRFHCRWLWLHLNKQLCRKTSTFSHIWFQKQIYCEHYMSIIQSGATEEATYAKLLSITSGTYRFLSNGKTYCCLLKKENRVCFVHFHQLKILKFLQENEPTCTVNSL